MYVALFPMESNTTPARFFPANLNQELYSGKELRHAIKLLKYLALSWLYTKQCMSRGIT